MKFADFVKVAMVWSALIAIAYNIKLLVDAVEALK